VVLVCDAECLTHQAKGPRIVEPAGEDGGSREMAGREMNEQPCPACGEVVRECPVALVAAVACPGCGRVLWCFGGENLFVPPAKVVRHFAEQLGISEEELLRRPAALFPKGTESLEVVELILELESEGEDG
jgi:hypothetical protein